VLLGNLDRKAARDRLRGHHPLRPGIQSRSPSTPLYDFRRTLQHPGTRPHNTRRATPGGYHTRPVWPDPLSLATTHGISFPAGTEMFHFPAYPPHECGAGPYGRRVPPFGNPRIKALSAAPRGLSRPHTSFIGTVCQGIHHTPLPATHTHTGMHAARTLAKKLWTTHHHTKMITKRSTKSPIRKNRRPVLKNCI
jgi:hypothetical protein